MEKEKLAEKILEQIKVIRDTGRTNMFMDYKVKEIAVEMGLSELVKYITDNPDGYFGTILRGKVKL